MLDTDFRIGRSRSPVHWVVTGCRNCSGGLVLPHYQVKERRKSLWLTLSISGILQRVLEPVR